MRESRIKPIILVLQQANLVHDELKRDKLRKVLQNLFVKDSKCQWFKKQQFINLCLVFV